MLGNYFHHDFIRVLERLGIFLHTPCVSILTMYLWFLHFELSLKAEISKSNAQTLFDSKDQYWQSTTNLPREKLMKCYPRSNYGILNVNVRSPFGGNTQKGFL